jgi:hypothetical protein
MRFGRHFFQQHMVTLIAAKMGDCLNQGCQMVCFQTKISIWVNFGGSINGKSWYIL